MPRDELENEEDDDGSFLLSLSLQCASMKLLIDEGLKMHNHMNSLLLWFSSLEASKLILSRLIFMDRNVEIGGSFREFFAPISRITKSVITCQAKISTKRTKRKRDCCWAYDLVAHFDVWLDWKRFASN